MPSYRVVLRGRLPSTSSGGEAQPRGFFVTRFVQAATIDQAGLAAMALLRAEAKFSRLVSTYGGQEPDLGIEELTEAEGRTDTTVNRSGYVFYEDDRDF